MRYKKGVIFICLIICLFTIASVCASDVNETIVASEDQNDEINGIENDAVVTHDNQVNDGNMSVDSKNVDEAGVTEENELSTSSGTFTDLANDITNAENELNLTKNYFYNGSADLRTVTISKPIIINGNGFTINGDNQVRIFQVYSSNVVLKNINFVNSYNHNSAGAIYWGGDNGALYNCSFINSTCGAIDWEDISCEGGAIHWNGKNGTLSGCSFVNCSAFASDIAATGIGYWARGGAIYWQGDDGTLSECNFTNSTSCGYYEKERLYRCEAGAVYWNGKNGALLGCSFMNSFVSEDESGDIYWAGVNGILSDCNFINSYEGAISWYGANGVLSNSSFYNCSSKGRCVVSWHGRNGLINKSYFSPSSNSIADSISDLKIIKLYSSSLSCENISYFYKDNINLSAYLNTDGKIIFNIINEYTSKTFVVYTTNDGIATLCDELNELYVGTWNVTVIFEGNDNYYPCNATATITVLPPSSSLTIEDINSTVGHEITLFANVTSSLTINEGYVVFFDGETNIGESPVLNGTATLTYVPTIAGEHTITAIFNSTNYLSSNDTSKLLVDSATIEVLADSGIVGFNSSFVAEVKGVYSTINEGIVTFYINDEYLGDVSVVNGSACLIYVPLNANTYTVKAVFGNSDKFLSDEDSISYVVVPADTVVAIDDMNGTVGHEVIINVGISSSNNLTINEGYVVFFDGSAQIGESEVHNGIATLSYTPTTAGEHPITAMYYGTNYEDNINSAALNVSKAEVILSIEHIQTVYFTNPSYFKISVLSNSKGINEGTVKYYVNGNYVRMDYVYDGKASTTYVTNTTGSFDLFIVYNETDNYFAKNISSTFYVDQMPTTLSGETVFFDEEESRTYSTTLKGNNTNGVYGQIVKIEAIKYSGESRTFTGVSDGNGITIYNVNDLAGGMWIIRGIYDGNNNYLGSTFTDRFIVIRMDTTTAIEEISNPYVNHTYKIKANIHDEDGKLVKEGIVQFYLDGVDIGSIDLSENQGHQSTLGNGVLGAVNPMFEYELGADEDADLYLNYVPTKAGKHTLTAVYEGTAIYKASNQTTTFVVKEGAVPTTITASSSITTVYNGGKYLVATLKDINGNLLKSVKVTVKIGTKTFKPTTDKTGKVKVTLNNLASVKTYKAIITFAGNKNYAKSTKTVSVKVNKATPKITAKAKTFKKAVKTKKYTITLKTNKNKVMKKAVVTLKVNKKTYKAKTNSKGKATFKITKLTKKGTFKATVTYKGNKYYNKVTKKVNIKIK